MAKKIPPLTDAQCRGAKYRTEGGNKLFDGGGLYLEILPTGGKRWRLKYRRPISRKETSITFGQYPDITLAKARILREQARQHLAAGVDPDHAPADPGTESTSRTFNVIAKEWLGIKKKSWSDGYHSRMKNALTANAYPYFGMKPIDQISGKVVLDAVRAVENRGAMEMATRVLDAIGMVFRYAAGIGEVHADVTQGLRQFLADRPPVQHFPHVDAATIPVLLQRIDGYHGRPETRFALQLMIRTFPRTNELRWARWSEFDLEAAIWEIPAERMKGSVIQKAWGPSHLVPLSRQTIQLLRDLQQLTGGHKYLFPGMRNPRGTISADTLNRALKIMGFAGQQTGHGFRGLASTVMNEHSGIRPDAIERQLAHKDRNKIRRTYNHAEYWDERCALMQWWSDYLDTKNAEFVGDAPYPIADGHTPIRAPIAPRLGLARLGTPCKEKPLNQ
ncbi:tyrosine-type recombinase/integrase [Castellaniella sp.]|uniref:tyrosine-type recombinase/integrase n=1 Tax=Castellaniella sp. TaxID=1955812 RepID=UPI00355F1245